MRLEEFAFQLAVMVYSDLGKVDVYNQSVCRQTLCNFAAGPLLRVQVILEIYDGGQKGLAM